MIIMISIPKSKVNETVIQYIIDKHYKKTLITYWYDWRFSTQKKGLVEWLKDGIENEQVKSIAKNFKGSSDEKVIQALRYVYKNIIYKSDMSVWKINEVWQTPVETLRLKTGDCEDGAILIYALCVAAGVKPYRLFLVAGDVVGGGHCYITYFPDEDTVERVIDWCYWYDSKEISLRPYYWNLEKYNYGTTEWFRLNHLSGSKRKGE